MASGHGLDVHGCLYDRLCVVPSAVEPGPSHRWRPCGNTMEPNHTTRRRIIPHGHGCYLGYRRIWSYSGKTQRCQQWWHSTTRTCSLIRRTCRICTSLWCTGHTSSKFRLTCTQTHTSTCVWSTGSTATPRNLRRLNMLDIIFWIAVGAFVGWNFPQPFWARAIQAKITTMIKDKK